MNIKLELLAYQEIAIQSVVEAFRGTSKNTFDTACNAEGIRSNVSELSVAQFLENIQSVLFQNDINPTIANLTKARELTIEMETGTGKTLVYIKTIYELFQRYGFTKFIILVPSVAIRQGVLNTLSTFEKQLNAIYNFTPKAFQYNSKKLDKVTHFIEAQHPQILVMTLASFNSEDKILNQTDREDLFGNMPFIEAIGRTNPIIIMDEPQEGMDTENAIAQIQKLNPLIKIRYSATHKVVKNLLYRLTPYDSYRQGLVKKIEVLTITEKHDEATLKLELSEVQHGKGMPKIKLKAWHQSKLGKFTFKNTKWLKTGDKLSAITNNRSYADFEIERIYKNINTQKWSIHFTNGTQVLEKQVGGNVQNIWALQLEWLIRRHFQKKAILAPKGIKCLSLIFIDKVANYMGNEPLIKNIFVEKYKEVYTEFYPTKTPTNTIIEGVQGYYFAQTSKGIFTDNENVMHKNKAVFDAILRDKVGLLSYGEATANKIEFIFSHSALGVGWDNPNIFNITTLNHSHSEIKKRQEIGRGLRICVNTNGERVYDNLLSKNRNRINQLTVIPNESYESFVTQYQAEIKDTYGDEEKAANLRHTHKGKKLNEIQFNRSTNKTINQAFERFWEIVSKKTDYEVYFDEEVLLQKSIAALNQIDITAYQAEMKSQFIEEIGNENWNEKFGDEEVRQLKGAFAPLDVLEELSKKTTLSHQIILKIIQQINLEFLVKNPPKFINIAAEILKNIQVTEMLKGVRYNLHKAVFPFEFDDFAAQVNEDNYQNTPNQGFFNRMLVHNKAESEFALALDKEPDVVCFMKLPITYSIKTPLGNYNPDFGIVMKRKDIESETENHYYFVIDIQATNDIDDRKALKESEICKIKCATKHFQSLGTNEVQYIAPVKDFPSFKILANQRIDNLISAK